MDFSLIITDGGSGGAPANQEHIPLMDTTTEAARWMMARIIEQKQELGWSAVIATLFGPMAESPWNVVDQYIAFQ